MNLNLSASLNIFKLLAKPSLCLPQATVATFADLPIPLDKAFAGQREKVDIKAVVLDKDDCFAYPEHNEVYDQYKVSLLIVQCLTCRKMLKYCTATFRCIASCLPWSPSPDCLQHFWSPEL